MTTIEIKHRYSGNTLYTHTAEGATMRDAVLAAVESGANISDADLGGANLSSANLNGANLNGAYLSGANLRDANLSGANLNGANLNGANLGGANLRGANLSGANLNGANLRGANLNGANLRGANLSGANLNGANLRGANLNGAYLGGDLKTLIMVPDLDAKILAAVEANPAALEMGQWHTCDTTHCRAGWAIHLAGPAGAVLEALYTPAVAGALIYAASAPEFPIPDFFVTNEEALADMCERVAARKA